MRRKLAIKIRIQGAAVKFNLTNLFEITPARLPDRIALADEFSEVRAVCSVKAGERPSTPGNVRDFCRTRLAEYKLPKAMKIVLDTKRSLAGKQDDKWTKSVFVKDT